MKVNVPDHARGELTKLRCWISGSGTRIVPGDAILVQLIQAIDDADKKK